MKNTNGMKWGIRALCLAAASTVALTAAAQVKISQVAGIGAGASTSPNADFVELFNPTTSPVDMSTWSVQISTGSGTSWSRQNIPASTILAPGAYYMIRLESATATPGYTFTADLQASPTITTLQSGAGIVALMSNQTTLTSCPSANANKVDLFGYGTATCSETTTKPRVLHTFGSNIAFIRNNNGCTDTNNNSNDFTEATPVFKSGTSSQIASASLTSWVNDTAMPVTFSARFNLLPLTYTCGNAGFTGPTSTGQAFSVDLSQVGGTTLNLTGVDGGTFTGTFTVPSGISAGTKTVTITGTDSQARSFTTNLTINIAAPITPPTLSGDLGTVSACPVDLTTTIAAGQVKWYKFVLPVAVSPANNNFLDMDTYRTATSTSAPDTYIALYNSAGVRLAVNDDVTSLNGGSGQPYWSALSFGATTPARAARSGGPGGTGLAYAGQSGSLPPGTYYLGASNYNATFPTSSFAATTTATYAGPFIVDIKYGDTSSGGGTAPTSFTNLGTIPTDGSTVSGSVNIAGPSQFRWFKFTTGAISKFTGTYLDLDTEGSAMTATAIGVFTSAGAPVATDTASGSGTYSQLTFGGGARPAVGDGLPYNGRNGALAAGDYYVVAASTNLGTSNPWGVTACGSTLGQITLNARSGTFTPTYPAGVVDLGTLASPSTPCASSSVSSPGEAFAAGQIVWYKATLPAINAALNQFVDIDTVQTTGISDNVIGWWDAYGNFLISADDTIGSFGCFSVGATTPARTYGTGTLAGANGTAIPAGTYYFATAQYISGLIATMADNYVVGPSAATGTGTSVLRITVGQIAAAPVTGTPTATDTFGTLTADGNFATKTNALSAGGINWYTFTLASGVDAAARTYLDIDTEGSTPGTLATQLQLFDSTGALVSGGNDKTSGTDALSQLSYGFALGRPAPGNGLAYDGGNGSTFAAGTYWIAASGAGQNYSANWGRAGCDNQTGTLKVNIRTGTQPPAAPPAGAIDLGVVRSVIDNANPGQFLPGVKTTGPVPYNGGVVWAKFQIRYPSLSSGTPTNYVDTHTIGTTLTPRGTGGTAPDNSSDTIMGIYYGGDQLTPGLFKDSNDEFAGGSGTRESLLSYGQTTPARSYTGSFAGTAAATGQNATGLSKGTYYIAAGGYASTYAFGAEYSASGFGAQTGTLQITVASNQPAWCNDADVAAIGTGVGGGPDGQNTVDDIIGYLGEFFANNVAVADLITLGGGLPAQPDGQVTVDDLIYFLNQFFAPCVP